VDSSGSASCPEAASCEHGNEAAEQVFSNQAGPSGRSLKRHKNEGAKDVCRLSAPD
jgi:hypothetical protein